MRKNLLMIAVFVLLCAASASALSGKVTYKEGNTFINYAVPKLRQCVNEGDLISTEKGRMEITLEDGSIVRIGEHSRIYFEKLRYEEKNKKISIKVTLGRFWTKVKKLVKGDDYNVSFRTGTAGVRGTSYRIDQFADDSALLNVYTGTVAVAGKRPAADTASDAQDVHEISGPEEVQGPSEITMEEWVKIVESMNSISVDAGGNPTEPEPFDIEKDREDPWVNWNLKRDEEDK